MKKIIAIFLALNLIFSQSYSSSIIDKIVSNNPANSDKDSNKNTQTSTSSTQPDENLNDPDIVNYAQQFVDVGPASSIGLLIFMIKLALNKQILNITQDNISAINSILSIVAQNTLKNMNVVTSVDIDSYPQIASSVKYTLDFLSNLKNIDKLTESQKNILKDGVLSKISFSDLFTNSSNISNSDAKELYKKYLASTLKNLNISLEDIKLDKQKRIILKNINELNSFIVSQILNTEGSKYRQVGSIDILDLDTQAKFDQQKDIIKNKLDLLTNDFSANEAFKNVGVSDLIEQYLKDLQDEWDVKHSVENVVNNSADLNKILEALGISSGSAVTLILSVVFGLIKQGLIAKGKWNDKLAKVFQEVIPSILEGLGVDVDKSGLKINLNTIDDIFGFFQSFVGLSQDQKDAIKNEIDKIKKPFEDEFGKVEIENDVIKVGLSELSLSELNSKAKSAIKKGLVDVLKINRNNPAKLENAFQQVKNSIKDYQQFVVECIIDTKINNFLNSPENKGKSFSELGDGLNSLSKSLSQGLDKAYKSSINVKDLVKKQINIATVNLKVYDLLREFKDNMYNKNFDFDSSKDLFRGSLNEIMSTYLKDVLSEADIAAKVNLVVDGLDKQYSISKYIREYIENKLDEAGLRAKLAKEGITGNTLFDALGKAEELKSQETTKRISMAHDSRQSNVPQNLDNDQLSKLADHIILDAEEHDRVDSSGPGSEPLSVDIIDHVDRNLNDTRPDTARVHVDDIIPLRIIGE